MKTHALNCSAAVTEQIRFEVTVKLQFPKGTQTILWYLLTPMVSYSLFSHIFYHNDWPVTSEPNLGQQMFSVFDITNSIKSQADISGHCP